jgi:hypothetical protein
VEQLDDDRDRQGGGNPVGYLAPSEVTLLGPRVARLRRFRAGASGVPAGYPISMRSGSWWCTPSLTMTSSKPFLKLALILLPSMPSASFILLLK